MALGAETDRSEAEQAGVAHGPDNAIDEPELAALLDRVDALIGQDDAAAAAMLKSVEEQASGNPHVDVRLAMLAMHAGDGDAARRYAVQSASAAPDNAAVVARSSEVLNGLGHTTEAFMQLLNVATHGALLDEFVATARALKDAEIGAQEAQRLRETITALVDRSLGAPDATSWTIANVSADLADKIQYPQAATRLRVRGHVDMAEEARVVGWAFDAADPDRRCEVEVVSDTGELIAEGRADRPREDLKQAGYSDGAHGYAIHIPHHKIVLCPSPIVRDKKTHAVLGTYALPRFTGALDVESLSPTSSHVTGWCIDRQRPKLRPRLVGVSGDREFPIGAASLYRADLAKSGLGDGFNGFEFATRVLRGRGPFSIIEARTGTIVFHDVQLKPKTETEAGR